MKKIRILSLSDQVVDRLYSEHVKRMFPDIDMIISCGDLPYYYLEFILDMLNVPMLFVHGNHDPIEEIASHGVRKEPWGAENMHEKCVVHNGVIFLGFEGSIRYSDNLHQYTQRQAWLQVLRKIPRLVWNRIRYGRFVDVLITHSPAFGIGDDEDQAHIGFKAYRWLIEIFKPSYHFHGHVHIYDHGNFKPKSFGSTLVINTCSYRRVEIKIGGRDE
ncbi:MAG: metallophosphoesterase [Anaerolineales bacterium]|jgi:Icc-related predicted phosphoesterase